MSQSLPQNINMNQRTTVEERNGVRTERTYDSNTGMITERVTGPGYNSLRTYPSNDPNRSNTNINNFSGGNTRTMTQDEIAQIFPPGFPFHNVNMNMNMGSGFPFQNRTRVMRGRRMPGQIAIGGRNDLNSIFGSGMEQM